MKTACPGTPNIGGMTATGNAYHFGDNDTLLRQHCLELAIRDYNGSNPCERAKAYYDFIKGTQELGSPDDPHCTHDPKDIPLVTRKVVFRAIMSGENLGEYLALRDRYDLGEVNHNGFPVGDEPK